MSIFIVMCIYWKIWNIAKCLTLMCGYKMGDVAPPVHSMKLKIIYGSKTSKTTYLDTISIQIFYIHMYYGGYSQKGGEGGQLSRGGGKCPLSPPK